MAAAQGGSAMSEVASLRGPTASRGPTELNGRALSESNGHMWIAPCLVKKAWPCLRFQIEPCCCYYCVRR